MRTLLKSGTVVTMNPRREILECADLLLEGDRIGRIIPGGSLDAGHADQLLDCTGKVIIPGLVSAHSHLTGMVQRGLWDEATFESWSRRSAATENQLCLSPEEIYAIHCAACIEFVRHGVTTALNMFVPRFDLALESVRAACRAFTDSGIRGVLALSLKDQSPDNPGVTSRILPSDVWQSLARRVGEEVRRFGTRMTFMLAPSAPQRCSDQLLGACHELAGELRVGIHTHLAETRKHAEVGRELYGEPIVKHLERVGFLNGGLSVAHAIWLDEAEIDLLRQHGVKVVHNPGSNMKLGSGIARIKKMLRQGVTVGLGADSVNAGTVYSIFEQMKLSVLLPRAAMAPEDWVFPEEALEMGTLGGAKALLLERAIGSIEEGKKADLVVLSPSMCLRPMNDLVSQLALCENGESVESVFVDGNPVIMNGALMTLDEREILAMLSALTPRIAQVRSAVAFAS